MQGSEGLNLAYNPVNERWTDHAFEGPNTEGTEWFHVEAATWDGCHMVMLGSSERGTDSFRFFPRPDPPEAPQ
jgi:hypothetical protein